MCSASNTQIRGLDVRERYYWRVQAVQAVQAVQLYSNRLSRREGRKRKIVLVYILVGVVSEKPFVEIRVVVDIFVIDEFVRL